MSKGSKNLSNSASTGGLGIHFENRVQTAYSVIMLAGGFSPCMPSWPITKIELQQRYRGVETDDLIVSCQDPKSKRVARLLGQVKHTISINNNKNFREVIQAAWNDYNNPEVFSLGSYDVIALICGPLSATDTNDVRLLLNQARESQDAEDFMRRIGLGIFTSNAQRKKLDVFKLALATANDEIELSNETLWLFLKSFRLLIYDLDIKGVTLSLLHTLIEQNSPQNAKSIWAQLYEHIQWTNEGSGFVTPSTIPEEISEAFQKPRIVEIPKNLVKETVTSVTITPRKRSISESISLACLVGSWNEDSESDKTIISLLSKQGYDEWNSDFMEILQTQDSPVSLKNGIWKVNDRKKVFLEIGPRISDSMLDLFQQTTIKVLSERNPKFELQKEDQFAASLHGKVLHHSNQLRKGLADGLALIGCFPSALTNASTSKPESIVIMILRNILGDADWQLWASLDDLLPSMAEASPKAFLEAVEKALRQIPCPYDNIFAQEESGAMGWNYISGLLWGLEAIAWEEEYLVNSVLTLAELAAHDPGGKWENRPSNSISTILLPWFPQTTASVEKRKVAITTLHREYPDITWDLLISLLPNQNQISSGAFKPRWRESIPVEWNEKVSTTEYWDQVSFYADLAVENAVDNSKRLTILINNLDNLPKTAYANLLSHLSSKNITSKNEEDKLILWSKLIKFIARHKRYSDTDWALKPKLIKELEVIAKSLKPTSALNLYEHLFTDNDFDLFDENDNWDEQQKKLDVKRQKALKQIFDESGLISILELVEKVDLPSTVGHSLGESDDKSIEDKLLPEYLKSTSKSTAIFIEAYVFRKFRSGQWLWVDNLKINNWTPEQISHFYVSLPFMAETWDRVDRDLGEDEFLYWNKVRANPHQEENKLEMGIDKLLKYKRALPAVECIYGMLNNGKTLDIPRSIKALMLGRANTSKALILNAYRIKKVISALQKDPATPPDDMFRIEWSYLHLLDGHHGATPHHIENRLANDPSFFSEVISIVYRPKGAPTTEHDPSAKEKALATNAWHLLYQWKTPPGSENSNNFNSKKFTSWLKEVLVICGKTGHLEVAKLHIGNVLLYSPKDSTGMWINKVVAEALNNKNADEMRSGFCTEIINSRGAHSVDPSGKDEKSLAAKWRQRAEDVENESFPRLALSLRGVAESYEREAKNIVERNDPWDD